jgi:HD-GYP domain-containing protein (c-di-GMP phosphodiesterase class II)
MRSVLGSAVSLAADLTRFRDADTGAHLGRVTRYARVIAAGLVRSEGLDERFVEDIASLAPAHDVGKLAIPDQILLKQGALEASELEVMRGHVAAGIAVVEELIRDFGLDRTDRVEMLRNIVRSHHEALDGSGYPDGLKGGAIPLEARIVAVADVFDALTSERPYNEDLEPSRRLRVSERPEGHEVRPGVRRRSRKQRGRGRVDPLRCRLTAGLRSRRQPSAGAPIAARMRRICARCTRSCPA